MIRAFLGKKKKEEFVFIEATDGTLYKSTEWTGAKTANSIVIKQPTVAFRIALVQDYMQISDHYYDPWENYVTSIGNENRAKLDMKSATNTSNMLKFNGWASYAAGYCASYTFPNGNTQGLLPALGWWQIAYENKEAVDACLLACGGAAMKTSTLYWTSTFYGNDHGRRSFWVCNWIDGHVTYFEVNSKFYARPFAEYN